MANKNSSFESLLDESQAKESIFSILFDFKKTYVPWMVLVIALGASYGIYLITKSQIETAQHTEFEKAVVSLLNRFEKAYDEKESVLKSLQGVFKNSYVSREMYELNSIVPKNSNPSISTLDWVYEVTENEMGEFIHYTRSQGYYDLVIRPHRNYDTSYIVQFVYPLKGNETISGYNYSENKNAVHAIKKARDNNQFVTSNVEIVRDSLFGFYLMAPVYELFSSVETDEDRRNNFNGVISLAIDVDKYFLNAVGEGDATDSTIVFKVIEKSDGNSEKVIFTSENFEKEKQAGEPAIQNDYVYSIADNDLIIRIATSMKFSDGFQSTLPFGVGAGAVVLSFVAFAFLVSVVTSRSRALNLAELQTRNQRRILDTSHDIIGTLNFDGHWTTINSASELLIGVSSNELKHQSINEYNLDEEVDIIDGVVHDDKEEYRVTKEIQILNQKTNEPLWISWNFSVSNQDKLIYAIGRDITLTKKQEEENRIRTNQIKLAEQFSKESNESKTYFLTELSMRMRNSLSSIAGYLQMITNKVYENEEELDNYVAQANESAEELFSFVSDVSDKAEMSDSRGKAQVSSFNFNPLMEEIKEKFVEEHKDKKLTFEYLHNPEIPVNLLADKNVFKEALLTILDKFVIDIDECHIQIMAQENQFESATEIQILTSPNPLFDELILVYNKNKENLIEKLEDDEEDFLLDIAISNSNIRRMNGTIEIESLGRDEENLIQLNMPLLK